VSSPLAADLVFADLRDALADLEASRGSPKQVRRAFSRFVDLSQRLTSAMRTDFSRLRGRKWEARSFSGWHDVTEFFKWLRNEDQHELPIYISVHEKRFYEIPGHPGELFPFEGTWVLSDQMLEGLDLGTINFYPMDPSTGESHGPVEPVRIEYRFLLQPHSDTARKRLQQLGTTDVHELSARCFEVLTSYHEHFLSAVRGT
jgi:hypothetical protein